MSQHDEQHAVIGYGTFIMVWLSLLVLTGLTVTVSGMNLASLSIWVALIIAAFKSSLVLGYFMHLKFEAPLFRYMVYMVIFVIAIVVVLLFTDLPFRGE